MTKAAVFAIRYSLRIKLDLKQFQKITTKNLKVGFTESMVASYVARFGHRILVIVLIYLLLFDKTYRKLIQYCHHLLVTTQFDLLSILNNFLRSFKQILGYILLSMIRKIHNLNYLSCPLGGQITEVLLHWHDCVYSIIGHFITIALILCFLLYIKGKLVS